MGELSEKSHSSLAQAKGSDDPRRGCFTKRTVVVVATPWRSGAQAVVKQIEQDGGRAGAIGLDLAESARVANLVDEVVESMGAPRHPGEHAGITGPPGSSTLPRPSGTMRRGEPQKLRSC